MPQEFDKRLLRLQGFDLGAWPLSEYVEQVERNWIQRESGSSVEGALFHARVKPGRRSRIAPQRGERIWRKIELRI
ncbi:MAG: hypothetical protein DMG31_00845 [Acidobacteria bacterium]|nr:MAG: hypothetical protein DMG31_00845 [Acidobacteriota bacterium]